MNHLVLDKAKLEDTLRRAQKSGDSKMVAWCERQLDCFKAYRRVEDVKKG